MGDEIELKLAVTPSDLVKICSAKSMLRNQLGDRKKADVASVYYDTPARVLKRNGISFRLRRQGGKYLQTVKAEMGDLARRKEWDRPFVDKS